ncbi:TetR/AcrR family transcriptional regulator [Pararhizobium sp. YC-54]|uniref:TetR/AcrR family transcriptional regulator n=1 Tax=Pararhizobium sp. YC-54 TaxID=2986920 RepID=UPI0021F77647|nr:TetR/AcrR family transcriptional regulator [Pararhizobium sp. YC-54]MCW0001229.1 TetR/AcrR family transcriptional regulator [Pararhizobium sp. YC-54]
MEITTEAPQQHRPRGRPREFDADAALDHAIAVFSVRGYHGTAISDLADAMQLTPGSLYKAFKDKRGILLAAFDRYRLVRSTKLKAAIAPFPAGRDKIRAALLFYAEAAHGELGQRGCLVIATAAELAVTDPVAAERVEVAHATNEAVMKDCVVLGQSDGSISANIDAAETARALLCLLQGMRIVGKTGRSRAEMMAVADMAMKLLD